MTKPTAAAARAGVATELAERWEQATADDGRLSRYFRHRGLSGVVPTALRLHPSLPYFEAKNVLGEFPAMVAQVQRLDGEVVALHRTYLDPDGDGKANVPAPKKLTPAVREGATRGAAIRLAEPVDGRLALCEGIETAVAVMEATWASVWVVSAGGLRTVEVPETVQILEIWADNDPTGVKAALAAAARFRVAGYRVAVLLPLRDGADWLDVLNADGADALQQAWAATPAEDLPARTRIDPGAPFEPAMLDALAVIRVHDPAAWARILPRLREAGVRVRDLERALRNVNVVMRMGEDIHEADDALELASDRADEPRPPPLRLAGAQTFVDDMLVYTFRCDDGDALCVVTSRGEVLDETTARSVFRITKKPDMPARLSEGALERIRGGDVGVDGRSLLSDLREFFLQYVELPSAQHTALILALWVMGTYVHQLFIYFAYLAIQSVTRRSGKSRLLEILSEVAFNATPVQTDPTPAALYRDIDVNACTAILDEVEALTNADKDKKSALFAILNIGFKAGATVTRVEKVDDEFRPVRYAAYSPKAFAGIRRLSDTLRDRAFVIPMKRKRRDKPLARFSVRRLHGVLQDLRDRLHLFALAHAADIGELYEHAEELPIPSELDDRARDVFEPLFAIAGTIDAAAGCAAVTSELMCAARGVGQARDAEECEDEGIAVAAAALAGLFANNGVEFRVLRADDAVERFAQAGLVWVKEPGHARSLLRRLGFRSGTHRPDPGAEPIRGYKITHSEIMDLQARYVPAQHGADKEGSSGEEDHARR